MDDTKCGSLALNCVKSKRKRQGGSTCCSRDKNATLRQFSGRLEGAPSVPCTSCFSVPFWRLRRQKSDVQFCPRCTILLPKLHISSRFQNCTYVQFSCEKKGMLQREPPPCAPPRRSGRRSGGIHQSWGKDLMST